MKREELLRRIARTLKQSVAPAVGDEYAKTQAFMAAVVLEKLGLEIGLADAHAQAWASDVSALAGDLDRMLAAGPVPVALEAAWGHFDRSRTRADLVPLIEALYATRGELGNARFDAVLTRVRVALRADIDRRMEYAR